MKSKNTLLSLKNKYQNERVFVIGNGPSLQFNDLTKLKDEYVIAASWFGLHKDYKNLNNVFYCLACSIFWSNGKLPNMLYNIMNINDKSVFVMESSFQSVNKNYHYFPEKRMLCVDMLPPIENYKVSEIDLTKGARIMSNVTSDLLLPLAFHLGFKETYIIGNDLDLKLGKLKDWSQSHFYNMRLMPNSIMWHMQYQSKGFDSEDVNNAYLQFRRYFEKNHRKLHNAGHGGKLGVFDKVNFNSLF